MKFTRDTRAEQLFSSMLGREGKMMIYAAKAGDWQFVVSYDALHDKWAASWQPHIIVPGRKYSSQQCEPPEPGEKTKWYPSQHAAEQACIRKYRELRANN